MDLMPWFFIQVLVLTRLTVGNVLQRSLNVSETKLLCQSDCDGIFKMHVNTLV